MAADGGGGWGWGRIAAASVVGAAAAFGVGKLVTGFAKSAPSDPYDAIPRASFIAATVDVTELRRSPVYAALFGEHGAAGPANKMLGVPALASACGFDPTSRVQKVAVTVPEEDGERGAFGVIARVEVTRDELETCTRALADKRGGKAETHESGSFVVLDDRSIGGALTPRLAYGRGGLLVVGKGAWFDAMLGAADHTQPSLRDAKEHVALRTALTAAEGFHAPTVLVTALLPAPLRERLKREMSSETDAPDASNAIMAGVLGVNAVGLALHVGGPGQNVDASALLACDDEPGCAAVESLLVAKKKEWSGELTLRFLGLGPVLDSIEVKREGVRVRVTASAQADALAAAIDRVSKLRASHGATAEPGPPPRRGLPKPNEEIPSPRGDGGARP
ncbi:MAG: hypothetical protein JWP97_429 [Labilithrix sp.]|nr:hypothetical protein [Labilithrix sp.]